jgi:uncharacterized protein (TIGR02594 family)
MKWLDIAKKHIGLKEIPGSKDNALIVKWLIELNAWWRDDLTPWCGTFAAACLKEAGISPPKAFYRAKAYLEWGSKVEVPSVGCVVIFDRKGGGHVGFVIGKDEKNRLLVLGGNQSDSVNIAPFDMSRVAGYRWPSEIQYQRIDLPVIKTSARSSANES